MKKKYTTKNTEKIIPKKSLGQNFLVNEGVLNKIIIAAEIKKDDIILEVGPGTGNLTAKLVLEAKEVIAVEKDKRLISQLQKSFTKPTFVNPITKVGFVKRGSLVKIVEGDILKFNPGTYSLKSGGYKIVANIPYYITSHFLRMVFERWPKPELIVLMIQKEVAQRITAKPPHTNLLALSVQFFAYPQIVGTVSRGSFRPMPKVDSAIIKLTPKNIVQSEDSAKLFKITKFGFSEKRKQLLNNLSKNLKIDKEKLKTVFDANGIRSDARAENLSLEEWEKLAKLLES